MTVLGLFYSAYQQLTRNSADAADSSSSRVCASFRFRTAIGAVSCAGAIASIYATRSAAAQGSSCADPGIEVTFFVSPTKRPRHVRTPRCAAHHEQSFTAPARCEIQLRSQLRNQGVQWLLNGVQLCADNLSVLLSTNAKANSEHDFDHYVRCSVRTLGREGNGAD